MTITRNRRVPLAVASITAAVMLSGCTMMGGGLGDLPSELPMVTPVAADAVPTATPTAAPTAVPTPAAKPKPDAGAVIRDMSVDVQDYWRSLGVTFMARMLPEGDPALADCDGGTYTLWLCSGERVGYDPADVEGVLTNQGAPAVALLTSNALGRIALGTVSAVLLSGDFAEDKRAQCASGAYMRWVVDGHSSRFSMTFDDVAAALETQYPSTGVLMGYNAAEMKQLQTAFKAGYTHAEPCLKGIK